MWYKTGYRIQKSRKTGNYLKTGMILCVSLILIIFVAGPAIQYSMTVSRNLSDTVSAEQNLLPLLNIP